MRISSSIWLAGLSLVAGFSADAQPLVLTNIAQCLSHVRTRTNLHCQVELTATITLWEGSRDLLVVQDDSGAMAIQMPLTNASLQVGRRVSLRGACVQPYVRSFPDFPDRPSGREYPASFEVPLGTGTYYLSRLRGYLCPPATGQYTFWIAADDSGELRLSTDTDPVNARRICGLPQGASTGRREWGRYPTQRSEPIELKAGKRYYVEALQMQGVGPDGLAVAWEGPGVSMSVIDGRYLFPWENPSDWGHAPVNTGVAATTNCILREYWNNYYVRNFFPLNFRSTRESVVRIPGLEVTVLGQGTLPEPWRFAPGDSPGVANELRWAEVEGVVSFAAATGRKLHLELEGEKSTIKVKVLDWPGGPAPSLQNARVRVRGVCENELNVRGRFGSAIMWVSSPADVVVLPAGEKDWSDINSALISEIEPSNTTMAWGRRIKVRGRVAHEGDTLLVQGNDVFEGFFSPDGTNWTRIGKPMEIGMSNAALIGFAVASHQTSVLATATFDLPQAMGTNWIGADLNSPGLSGRYSRTGSTYTVSGSGRRIWSGADQCFYLHQTLEGEGEITARLADFESSDRMGQAGLMIRESLDRSSVCASLLVTPAHGARFQYRRMPGEFTMQFDPIQKAKDHEWIKVVRRKNYLPVRTALPVKPQVGEEVDVVGTLIWEKSRPVLAEASCRPVDPGVAPPAMFSPRRLRNISIGQYLAEAQLPSQPYMRGYLEAAGLRGVVTFCDPIFSPNMVFIQDASSGLSIVWPDTNLTTTLQIGQLVDVSGRSSAGQFPVTLEPSSMTVMGWGPMPAPAEYSGDRMASRSRHAQWVQVEGVVRSASPSNMVNIMCREGLLTARVGRIQSAGLKDYVNALVRARGVLSLRPGDPPVLLVPSPAYLEIEELPPKDPFAVPSFSMAELAGLNARPETLRQMKVAGVVIGVRPKGLFVQDDSGGAMVHTIDGASAKPGDLVEVVGFPVGQHSAVLTEALVRKTGVGRMPEPFKISAHGNEEVKHSATLVQFEAAVVEQRNSLGEQTLILQTGPKIFEAVFILNASESSRLPSLPAGSRVAVTGVCQLERAEPVGTNEDEENLVAAPLRVWLRGPDDVVLLERPPWLTWKHAAIITCVFGCGLCSALLWVRLLRRRVAQRTHQLHETMSQLEKETRTSAVLAERDRLAGEIHDSLEQGLTAIMLQLDAASKVAQHPEEARRYLGMARSMAGFSRAEVQHAVWDLQSPLLENADLGTALTHVASEISAGDSQQVTVKINGDVHPLPSSVEHHLLRIGQEAITNAVKHAKPRIIQVTLDYSENQLRLSVRDDGNGFVPDTALNAGKDGHFGLQGIRGRVRKVNGELDITSRPGQGATIAVTVPLNGGVQENGSA